MSAHSSDRTVISAILRERHIEFEVTVIDGDAELEAQGIGATIHFLFDKNGNLENLAAVEHRPAHMPASLDDDFELGTRQCDIDGEECEACT